MEDEDIKHVKALIEKAAETHDSGDAMRFSQAANNAANALCSLQHRSRMADEQKRAA